MGVLRNIKSKMNVFIIDDSPVYRELLKNEVVDVAGCDVYTFSSAEACFSNATVKPDLVILDLYLDDGSKKVMSGHEALRKLLSQDEEVQIVMISAEVNEALLQEYKMYRGVDFILKSEDLSSEIKEVLNNMTLIKQ